MLPNHTFIEIVDEKKSVKTSCWLGSCTRPETPSASATAAPTAAAARSFTDAGRPAVAASIGPTLTAAPGAGNVPAAASMILDRGRSRPRELISPSAADVDQHRVAHRHPAGLDNRA